MLCENNMKKCIVLDLDNTLWGGIVGEDGLEGIRLSLSGEGSNFIAFQQALLDLYNKGIILAINSRNNFDDAIKVIRSHPNMILKENHFVAMRINWNDKAENLVELAKEINIGLDSIVFLDDDPMNRALIRNLLPEVDVPDLPRDPAEYARFLLSLSYFNSEAITDEDKMRGNLYVTERLRKEAEKAFNRKEDFLKDLRLELEVFIDELSSIARLAQLTEKTNQFNVNKEPLSEDKIRRLIEHPQYGVFYARVKDRFGDYGITNFAVALKKEKTWDLKYFLMSCRSIGRGIEDAFLSFIGSIAKNNGVNHLSINFVETEKNKPAQEFVSKNFGGKALRKADINNIKKPKWIIIKNSIQ